MAADRDGARLRSKGERWQAESPTPRAHGRRCTPTTSSASGRRYVERATGVAYDLCHGNPLLGDDPEVADVFFAEDGSLWFLRRADGERVSSTWMGTMGPMPT